MPLNEIEVPGSSLSIKVWKGHNLEDALGGLNSILIKLAAIDCAIDCKFDIENETPGFHDCKADEEIFRGYYSGIVPFEVEHLVDGVMKSEIFKRIESCEFILTNDLLLTMGKPGPAKGAAMELSNLTGYAINLVEFEFQELDQLQHKMNQLKAVALSNPKENEVRKIRLSGRMEDYANYNVVDPRNHQIDSVSGLVNSPLGSMTVTLGKKGQLRLNVSKGMIVTVDCLKWILDLVKEQEKPEEPGLFNSGYEESPEAEKELPAEEVNPFSGIP